MKQTSLQGFLIFITCWFLTLTLIQLEMTGPSCTPLLKSDFSHQGKAIQLVKIFQWTKGWKEKTNLIMLRAYKLVLGGEVYFPDSTFPPVLWYSMCWRYREGPQIICSQINCFKMPQTVRLFNLFLDVCLKYIRWLKLFLVTTSILPWP